MSSYRKYKGLRNKLNNTINKHPDNFKKQDIFQNNQPDQFDKSIQYKIKKCFGLRRFKGKGHYEMSV